MKTKRVPTLSNLRHGVQNNVCWFLQRRRQSEEMEIEVIPAGNIPDVSFQPEADVETRCLRELCGDGNAFMGLDDQSLLVRLTKKDDDDYVDLDLNVPLSQTSFGSDGQKIDTISPVNGEEMTYIPSKEMLPQIIVPATSLVLPTVVVQTATMKIPTTTVTEASCLAPPDTLVNATTTVTACTTLTITTVPTTFKASPITMVSAMQTATSMVSTTSIARQTNVAPPVSVVSTMVYKTTTVPPTAMQGVPKDRGDQRKSKKMDKLKVSTYLWTNDVDFNRKGAFGVSKVHIRAYKGKPGVPGMKTMSTLDSAYLGEFAGNYQLGGETLRWIIKKDWPNGSLNTWLDKDPKRKIIDENAARYIAIRLLEAVQYLHSRGFYHGNINPSNIYINDKGQSVLGGLRAAIKYNGMRSLRADKEYDFKFFSPELLTGPYMHRSSDIFSVGSVAFFVISGRYPFRTKEDLINLEYEPEYSLDFSLHAEMFLYQCLEKTAENRLRLGPYLNNVYRDRWFASMEEDDVANIYSPSPLIQTMEKMKK